MLASFTMGAHTFFLGFLFLCIGGVLCEENEKVHVQIKNKIYTNENDLTLNCEDSCDNSGEILDCLVTTNDKCILRYYIVCLTNHVGKCQTVKGSCPNESGSYEDKCEDAIMAKKTFSQAIERQSRRSMRSSSSALSMFRNPDDWMSMLPIFKAADVATSGNAHAITFDGTQIVESHNGGPPIITNLQKPLKHRINYANTWGPSTPQYFRQDGMYDQPNYPLIKPNQAFLAGQEYGSPYAYHYQPYQKGAVAYAGTNPYNAFGGIFKSVGLQDPMLMLRYLPVS